MAVIIRFRVVEGVVHVEIQRKFDQVPRVWKTFEAGSIKWIEEEGLAGECGKKNLLLVSERELIAWKLDASLERLIIGRVR